jgi:hypothetical protein
MKLAQTPPPKNQSCCGGKKSSATCCSTPETTERKDGPDRRASVVDRRSGLERRVKTRVESGYTGPERRVAERRQDTGLERRRGPGRRLSDSRKSAEEGEMNAEQFEFVMAIEAYKKVNKRMFPSWTEVLEVIQQLGYRKVEHRDMNLENVPEPELTAPR